MKFDKLEAIIDHIKALVVQKNKSSELLKELNNCKQTDFVTINQYRTHIKLLCKKLAICSKLLEKDVDDKKAEICVKDFL